MWERFGHNALWVHDPRAGTDLAYNWGMFSFDQEGFLGRLLKGTMMYWMAPFPIDRMIDAYVAEDRSIFVQELALTTDQKLELQAALAQNALPENMYYRYDYYQDNCSTRVRDALDRVLDGSVRRALEGVPTGTSYRFHTRRLLQPMPMMYTGIQVVLSDKADREIDRWREAFLPIQLMEGVREVRVPDGLGGERSLVMSEREVYHSTGLAEATSVPSHLRWYLVPGLALALLLFLLAHPAAWARVPMVALITLWSVVAGVAGVVLLGSWIFTDHVFWYPNANLLQLNPLSLAVGALALPVLVRPGPGRRLFLLAAVVAGLSVLGLVLKFVNVLDQQNGEILALTLPANLAVLGALARLRRSARSSEAV